MSAPDQLKAGFDFAELIDPTSKMAVACLMMAGVEDIITSAQHFAAHNGEQDVSPDVLIMSLKRALMSPNGVVSKLEDAFDDVLTQGYITPECLEKNSLVRWWLENFGHDAHIISVCSDSTRQLASNIARWFFESSRETEETEQEEEEEEEEEHEEEEETETEAETETDMDEKQHMQVQGDCPLCSEFIDALEQWETYQPTSRVRWTFYNVVSNLGKPSHEDLTLNPESGT